MRDKESKKTKEDFLIRRRLKKRPTPWKKVQSAFEQQFGRTSLDTIRSILYASEGYKRQRSQLRMICYSRDSASPSITNLVPSSTTYIAYGSEDAAGSTAFDPKATDQLALGSG